MKDVRTKMATFEKKTMIAGWLTAEELNNRKGWRVKFGKYNRKHFRLGGGVIGR